MSLLVESQTCFYSWKQRNQGSELINISNCIKVLDLFNILAFLHYQVSVMGQQESIPQPKTARTTHESQPKQKQMAKIQHEGLLKIRATPFPSCVEIFKDDTLLFLQNSQITLYDLLQARLYTNRLFPIDDIQKLIENVTYTLAYLNQFGEIYRDLNAQNIYYCNAQFKLLPNQLIEQTYYEKAWQKFYGQHHNEQQNYLTYLSPQLIIALRMKQKVVEDLQILSKSCIFMFGFILLQTTTLMPSSQCYDPITFDIFNNIVSERLELVEQHYNQCIARIIANMIDYDFNERMDVREFSIWVNRELSNNNQYQKSNNNQPIKSTISSKSQLLPQPIQINQNQQQKVLQQQLSLSKQIRYLNKNYTKNNTVYINGYDDYNHNQAHLVDGVHCGSKNLVYLGNLPYCSLNYEVNKVDKAFHDNTNIISIQNIKSKNSLYQIEKKLLQNQLKYKYQGVIRGYKQVFKDQREAQNIKQYGKCKDYLLGDIKLKQINKYPQYKRINSNDNKQNKHFSSFNQISQKQRQFQFLKKQKKYQIDYNNNKKYIIDQKYEQNKTNQNDSSINRIKYEIQKSRKLIQEFRKCQQISY